MHGFRSASLLLLLACGAADAAPVPPPAAVARLDLARYAGQWHEIARLPMFFQRNCASNVTATYTPRADGRLDVDNACLRSDGTRIASRGVARLQGDGPGKLEVRFAPAALSALPFVWADYWVLAVDDDYQWAVVGGRDREYLWILSRQPRMEPALLASLQRRATAMGYVLDALVVSPAQR